jgi:pheromone shutdown protein TraB
MREIKVNGSKVLVLPVIKGLVSEGEKVRAAILETRPDAVGVSISKEEMEGMRSYRGEEIELSDLEEAYRAGLQEFGEVQLPPPCYLEALRVCDELGIPVIPIDMNEELFSDRYCDLVGGWELVKESYFAHRLAKKRFDLKSVEGFVLDYDRKVNGGRGICILNKEREEHMAVAVINLSRKGRTVLVAVELERISGFLGEIEGKEKV